ncbi:MAG: pantoate--beta-alanine ligase [Flavobacteriales bacterium]
MNKCTTIEELKGTIRAAKSKGKRVGFVPTMGALHPGHASLIEQAAEACEVVVVSIFVNPTQFNNQEDFETYPLTMDKDLKVAKLAGATVVFVPHVDELYGGNLEVAPVDYGLLTSAYEGQKRSGHFDGVVAVVRKLFAAVDADRAFFGEKDLQQLAVIRRLAQEEFKGLEIVGCPLIRERDGLAMSSRNIRLGDRSRQEALALHDWLNRVKDVACAQGDIKATLHAIESEASSLKAIDLEYIDVVDAMTFEPLRVQSAEKKAHAIVAANVGGVRLIDNCALACS